MIIGLGKHCHNNMDMNMIQEIIKSELFVYGCQMNDVCESHRVYNIPSVWGL